MTVTTAVVVLPRRVAVWASRRALARNSVTGIELACALCAAVWFSAGTPLTALAGGAALAGGYLARRVGGQLAVGVYDGWLARICALAGELAVYAGLAAGAAPGARQVWPLATAAAVLLGMRKVARLIRPARPAAAARPGNPPEDRPAGTGRALAALAARVPALPAGERAVVITVTAAVYGTRMSLLVLTWWGAVALAWAVAGPTATILLCTLGLHGLAGLVLLTPVAAMLLAAPGSAHPHDKPLDWLTPLVIQAGQYAYLAALGFAKGVPGPLVFALIGLVAVRQ